MSSSALQWVGEARKRYGSRGTAALVAVLLDLTFIYLFSISFHLIPGRESPAAESIVTRLIEQPRGRYSEAPLPVDRSAIDAVKRYRFTPHENGPHAGQSWTTVKLEFDLIPLPVPTTVVGFDSVLEKTDCLCQARR